MRIIYGPIRSLGLGKAIAVDPISRHPKVCNFNCVYCSLGQRGIMLLERTEFIDDALIMEQMGDCLQRDDCEAVIFKGTGEPLLASNIFSMVNKLKQAASKQVVLLTNGSLLKDPQVLNELKAFDIIIAKLDAACEETFQQVNRPDPSIKFCDLIEGLRKAREKFQGSFRIQVTLVRENIGELDDIAQICRDICPDYVYLNHTEHCDPFHQVSRREVQAAMNRFFGIRCISSIEKE